MTERTPDLDHGLPLPWFHRLVPAAEELDRLQELESVRFQNLVLQVAAELDGRAPTLDDAVALVCDVLGGTVLSREGGC